MNILQQRLIDVMRRHVMSVAQIRDAHMTQLGEGLMLSKLSRALDEMVRRKWLSVRDRGYCVTTAGFVAREKIRVAEAQAAGQPAKILGIPLDQIPARDMRGGL